MSDFSFIQLHEANGITWMSPWCQMKLFMFDAMLANCCRWVKNPLCPCGQTEMNKNDICLLLGATGVGKTLMLKRLQNILCVLGLMWR